MSKKHAHRCVYRGACLFEFPPELIVGGVNVCIYENCGIAIQNYDELLTCTKSIVRVTTRIGCLRVEGDELAIRRMDGRCITLTGRVDLVCYEL